jgi:uncharacterized damage-inducible protein DinB
VDTTWVRELYDYHWWANAKLLDVTAALGPEAAAREVGKQFSYPTLLGMFAHVYGADLLWLARWKGESPGRMAAGADFASLAELRARWTELEAKQRAFLHGLSGTDLLRTIEFRHFSGRELRVPLRKVIAHVANHATHHRSEAATMLTMISGSPPDTGLHSYELERTGQSR